MILDDYKQMGRLDISKVIKVIDKFPEQCIDAIKSGKGVAKNIKFGKPKRVFVCGMGGSGIAGNILTGIYPDKEIKIFNDYSLPKYVKKGDLLFAVSYSGNTEETLAVFREAKRRGCNIIAITSGGKIEKECSNGKIHYVSVPKGIKPRFAIGYLLFPMIVILEKLKFIGKQNLDLVVKNLRETRDEICAISPLVSNPAKRIALKLVDTVPVVQGFGMYEPVAYRAATQFNENAKVPSFSENYPELNHNSILGWYGAGPLGKYFTVLVIRDENETDNIRKRIEFTKKIMKKNSRSVIDIWTAYPNALSRLLSSMYVLDFVSVYLGVLRNKDPGDDSLILKMKTILSGQ